MHLPRAYNGNILVNALCVGVARTDRIFYAAAAGIGNPVLYVGAKTGRDGIHGATMASAEFGEETEAKRPTVQVGDPFTEKLLIEACLELMEKDCIVAIQDMGAAGLTSSSVEMAARGECGIELDLDRVPLREGGMTPYEIMLSESQERMLMVLARRPRGEALAHLRKWDLDCAVVGRVTDTGRMVLRWAARWWPTCRWRPSSGASPVYDRPCEASPRRRPVAASDDERRAVATARRCCGCWARPTSPASAGSASSTTTWSWATRCSGRAATPPWSACTARPRAWRWPPTARRATALPIPRMGGTQAVAEAWRNLVAVGARPLAITNCLNFGNPERPPIMGQLVGCIEGMAEACRALDFPVVSGNVSLYNETDGKAILPTPNVGGVGLIADSARMVGPGWERGPGPGADGPEPRLAEAVHSTAR